MFGLLDQCGSQTVRPDALVRRFNFSGASQNNLDYTMEPNFNRNYVSFFAKMNGLS